MREYNLSEEVTSKRRAFFYALSIVVGFAVYFLFSSLNIDQRVVIAIVSVAVVLWVSEVIPLYITALISSFLLIVLTDFSVGEVFAPYFDPVIVLFLGGFILARGIQKYDLDHYFAYSILERLGNNPYMFILGMMGITAFLSMWMSNTASAVIMIPICIIVLKKNKLLIGKSKFAKGAVLAVAYAATIGGIGTLVGSPPNAIAAKYLKEGFTQSSMGLTFLGWMGKTLPFVIISLLFVWIMISLINKPEVKRIKLAIKHPVLSKDQKTIITIFFITVMGWITTGVTGLSSSTIAIIPIILLFGTGLLKHEDINKINWGTLLLFGGGLSLGLALTKVKIDVVMGNILSSNLAGLPQLLIIVMIVFFCIVMTMIVSNTASAAMLIPLLLPLSATLNIDLTAMAMLIAIGVSLDFMMPVGTPPNAIAYSTGLVKVKDMIKNGFIMNMGTGLILSILFYFFYI